MLIIAAHDVPDAEASLRSLRKEARQFTARYPAINACRFELRSAAPESGFEAHMEIVLPQHQLIVNAAAEAPERALAEALERAARDLAGLALRDPSVTARKSARK